MLWMYSMRSSVWSAIMSTDLREKRRPQREKKSSRL